MLSSVVPGGSAPGSPIPEISGLTADSRQVRPGYLFAALPGGKLNGRHFIEDAVTRGAAAILTDDARGLDGLRTRQPPVAVVADPNPRRRLALMAARFHAPQPRTIAAVTGTSGKTSVAAFTRQLWQRLGRPAASLGTLGIVAPGFTRPGSLTTPDPVTLHRDLAELARSGVDHVAMEASSHGLDQYRLDGIEIGIGAFTNLSREHLDYHPTMAAYPPPSAGDAVIRSSPMAPQIPPTSASSGPISSMATSRLACASSARKPPWRCAISPAPSRQ